MKRKVTIGVIADTHGLIRPELLDQFKGVDCIVHAGDVGSQEVLNALQEIAPVYAVRGNADKGALAKKLPKFEMFEVAGRVVYVIHDLKDIDLAPSAAGIAVIISGHTHQADFSQKKGIYYLNPGSAGPRRFKLPVSAAILEVMAPPGRIHAEPLDMKFIKRAVWKEQFRIVIHFDSGVSKTVNLDHDIRIRDYRTLQEPEYFRQFSIAPLNGSLIWPNGERYTGQRLYEIGIRCQMDFYNHPVEWYLSCFDEYLDKATILFARNIDNDYYIIPLFILFSQNGCLYKVEDEIIDWCDPTCCMGWEDIRKKTSKKELLYDIEHNGLGIIDGVDYFAEELQQFLNGKDFPK